jgi:hypothetical protein
MLQTAGLPATFSPTNPFGQTWQVEVLQPTAGNLQAFALSTGGTSLTDLQAAKIANIVGAIGGFLPQNDSGLYPGGSANAYGTAGGWGPLSTTNYPNITGGHLAALLNFTNGQLVSNFLYRNSVPGQPQLNTMNTPIQFGTSAVQTSGGACVAADLGKLSRDTTGHVLMCDGSNWKTQGSAFWQDPVANFAALPACNAAAINQTRVAQTPSVGTGPRAYTCDGAVWQALGVNDSGNMTISGTATMANAAITGTATVGAACAPNGLVAQDGTGLLLSCQSGVWISNTACPYVGSPNLDWYEGSPGTSSCINGYGMPGAPTGDWYFVEIKRHYNPGNYYEVQTAHAMTGPVGTIYERVQQSGAAGSGWGTWTKQGGSVPVFTNVWIGIPMGAVNISAYLPAGYTAAFITSCGGNSTMDGMNVAYNSLGGASCGAIMASPGIHSFGGASWFSISGYWK